MTGQSRPLGAQEQQARKAAYAGHREVEQHQIHFGMGFERRRHAVEVAGLEDRRSRHRADHRLTQGPQDQRMIVRYQDMYSFAHAFPLRDRSSRGRKP